MTFLYLLLAAAAPVILIANGKRWLGAQTHPAAVFILSWMLCALILNSIEAFPVSTGVAALVWVAVCFPVVTILCKKRKDMADSGPAAVEAERGKSGE